MKDIDNKIKSYKKELDYFDKKEKELIETRMSKLVNIEIQTDEDDELKTYLENENFDPKIYSKDRNNYDKENNSKFDINDIKLETEKLINLADIMNV